MNRDDITILDLNGAPLMEYLAFHRERGYATALWHEGGVAYEFEDDGSIWRQVRAEVIRRGVGDMIFDAD